MGDCLIGVMVGGITPAQRGVLRQLCQAGRTMGMTVFVFTPQAVDWKNARVRGQSTGAEGQWITRLYPLPDAVYNRCFARSGRQYQDQMLALRALKQHGCEVINVGLKGKWSVYAALSKRPDLQPHLPETVLYEGPESLLLWFQRHEDAFIKPVSGSQGKGSAHLSRDPGGGFTVRGRDGRNRAVRLRLENSAKLSHWIRRWTGNRKYLIQEYLNLRTLSGHVFDIRALVQKSGDGRWQLTGMAVRKGAPGSSTSNLHGGGSAEPAEPFLRHEYGAKPSGEVIKTLHRLVDVIPPAVEEAFGRFCELGLDFGVDRQRRVWLLEVNSKPGRAVFRKLGMKEERLKSVINPLLYAAYLLKHQRMEKNRASRPNNLMVHGTGRACDGRSRSAAYSAGCVPCTDCGHPVPCRNVRTIRLFHKKVYAPGPVCTARLG